MDPFRLACPQCLSKIVVRHEQLLGQTLPCPKCQGPVNVPVAAPSIGEPIAKTSSSKPLGSTPTQSAVRPGASLINSAAMTKVGELDWNDLLASEDFSNRADAGDAGLRFKAANEPDFIPIPPTYTPISASDQAVPSKKRALQSSSVAKQRQVLTLATVAITGSIFAILCFFAFIKFVGMKEEPVVNIPNSNTDTGINRDDTALATQKSPIVVPEIAMAVPSEDSSDLTSAAPQTNEVTAPQPEESSKSTPEETTPAGSDVKVPATLGSSLPGREDVSDAMPGVFADLSKMLTNQNTSALTVVPGGDLPAMDIESAELYLTQIFHPAPKAIPNWDKNSKLALATFRLKDVSLLKCIDLFGRMTGVGITVDWQSCQVAGINLSKKIDINEKDKSIADLVNQIVQENGLEWALDDQGLPVISAPVTAMEARMPMDWSVDGLFPDGFEQQGCDTLIRLWGYDDVCSFADGKIQWNERASPIDKANLQSSLFELSKIMRVADEHRWHRNADSNPIFDVSQWNNSFAAMEHRIGGNVLVPEKRPIPDLLMTAAEETKLNLIIDWQNAWSHGLIPNESVSLVLRGRTFPQVAERFLTDYALELVPIREDTLWMTTRDARRKLIRIVPVRMPKNFKLEDLKKSLRMLAPLGPDDRTRFRVVPVPGAEDLYFARICTPKTDQLNDPDLVFGLGWPIRP